MAETYTDDMYDHASQMRHPWTEAMNAAIALNRKDDYSASKQVLLLAAAAPTVAAHDPATCTVCANFEGNVRPAEPPL